MAVITRQGSNLMASLCRDADRCSRRSRQITQQCNLCLSKSLLKRLHTEQAQIERHLRELQKLIAGLDRDALIDPLAVDFVSEVTRRALLKSRFSLN